MNKTYYYTISIPITLILRELSKYWGLFSSYEGEITVILYCDWLLYISCILNGLLGESERFSSPWWRSLIVIVNSKVIIL